MGGSDPNAPLLGVYAIEKPAPELFDFATADLTLQHEVTHWDLVHSAFGVFARALRYVETLDGISDGFDALRK